MRLDTLQSIPVLPALLEGFWRLGLALRESHLARATARGALPHRLECPVISVGNLTVGGTGKTPVVEALARGWLRRGGNPGILSRGYRGGPDGNDEFRVLGRRLPGVPHVQDPDRRSGGERLLAEHPEVDLILLDDGFQHRRLARDVDLVLIDATEPLGNGHCLPRGRLREPWSALARADALLLTRLEEASPHKSVILDTFLAERFPELPRIAVRERFPGFRSESGTTRESPPPGPVAAFAGIGNPGAFFRALRRLGLPVAATREFPDHHHYREADLVALRTWAMEAGAVALICTEKDGVKLEELAAFGSGDPEVLQLRLEVELAEELPLDLVRCPGHGL